MDDRIRILLVDDHPLMVAGLKMTISQWAEFDVVGVASNGLEAVQLCQDLVPNLVIMDMQMPELSGWDAIDRIKSCNPHTRILALTTFDDAETVASALEAGCDGFLLKVIDPEELRAALHSLLKGIRVFDEDVMDDFRKSQEARNLPNFSSREIQVLNFIGQGMTNAEIAEKISLRPGTVKNLVSLLLNKTACISRAQLVNYALKNNLVK